LSGELDSYHLFHATRAELLRALDRTAEAADADFQARSLTMNPAERELLALRLIDLYE
jgi:predicted RNA polymerase sigma factor